MPVFVALAWLNFGVWWCYTCTSVQVWAECKHAVFLVNEATVVWTPVDAEYGFYLFNFFERPRGFGNACRISLCSKQFPLGILKDDQILQHRKDNGTYATTWLCSHPTEIAPSKETIVFFVECATVSGVCSQFVDYGPCFPFKKRKCNFLRVCLVHNLVTLP